MSLLFLPELLHVPPLFAGVCTYVCRFQPTEEENEVYKNYKGKVNELTEADQFLHEVRTQ